MPSRWTCPRAATPPTPSLPSSSARPARSRTATATVTCSLPADVYLQVSAIQRAGRALLHAYGFDEISCDGPTHYSLTGAPYDGILRGGNATVEVDYSSFSGRRSVYGSVNATV